MKISKSLLQSIALGVALGTLGTSCTSSVFTPILDTEEVDKDHEVNSESNPDVCDDWGDCPACGLG